MDEIKKIIYKTFDGKIFEKKEEAEEHEKAMMNVKAFKVYAYPDLTEGRYSATFQGYLLINASGFHNLFAEDWCYRKYGNGVAFVQGVYGANAIVQSWKVAQCDLRQIEEEKIIDKIEDRFVKKLWS